VNRLNGADFNYKFYINYYFILKKMEVADENFGTKSEQVIILSFNFRQHLFHFIVLLFLQATAAPDLDDAPGLTVNYHFL
jgi:hypothetical protein